MKTTLDKQNSTDFNVRSFTYKMENLEKELLQEHEAVKNEIAIPLAKDLGAMNKPEPDCEIDVYSKVLESTYSKMMAKSKKEIGPEIESLYIVSERESVAEKRKDIDEQLEKKQKGLRIKERELDEQDNSLLKKDKRYTISRFFLSFIILIDLGISSTAFQSAGYSLILSLLIGLALGGAIYFIAENIVHILNKGKTRWQKWGIAMAVFSGLFALYYVLGTFRSASFIGNDTFGNAIRPEYFAGLNMFFTITACLVAYFNGLTPAEKKILDQWKLAKEEVDKLTIDIQELKARKEDISSQQAQSELARQKIQLYAHDIQELIQRLFEESQHTFYSTNAIHRSDHKVPVFFKNKIPQLPSFYKGLNI